MWQEMGSFAKAMKFQQKTKFLLTINFNDEADSICDSVF